MELLLEESYLKNISIFSSNFETIEWRKMLYHLIYFKEEWNALSLSRINPTERWCNPAIMFLVFEIPTLSIFSWNTLMWFAWWRPNFPFHIAHHHRQTTQWMSMYSFRKNVSFHDPRMFSHECVSMRPFTFPESQREAVATAKPVSWHTFSFNFINMYLSVAALI